ncbi:MAG: VOC family protein [Vicinamibacterales bacterium]|jgi:hypothetical protein|nr:hypothetical protein [Acidobacteriota bacterium]MDP7294886.1 VOC family protein [Vicinamibacterales bacterium]MDP7472625.1 VOC family protein [Vicinamibacterales bacterium]MDP7670343.1 VOC family protein [Vicinamibacterales bacterium]HJO38000.1 VOC family protein [Vicinamibacterales bacterium]|tara:strand:- start:2307 stop:3119 length:813 start_codon:yes stop_codon:yes gene_type:complete
MGAPPSIRLDHLVILVRDLPTAVTDYRRLGFTVTPGGRHADGATHNAQVVFDDDTYFELVAFTDRWTLTKLRLLRRFHLLDGVVPPDPSFGSRVRRRGAVGDGLIDYALVPDDAEQRIRAARGRGLLIDGPLSGSRVRPDGQKVAWQFGFPHDPNLPFFCADKTPRALRVPEGDVRRHRNGAVGIARLTVYVRDLGWAAEGYGQLLGLEPRTDSAGEARFRVGTDIIVRAHGGTTKPAKVTLRTSQAGHVGTLDRRLTEGVDIELVAAEA